MHPVKIDLTLTSEGRHLAFSKEPLEVAHVFRRVGGAAGPWQRVALNTRSPYLDADVFALRTQPEYYVQHETQQGAAEVRSHLVSTAPIVQAAAAVADLTPTSDHVGGQRLDDRGR